MHGPGKWPQRWVFLDPLQPIWNKQGPGLHFSAGLCTPPVCQDPETCLSSPGINVSTDLVLLNIVLLNTSSCALMHSEAKLKCFSLKQRKVYCEENGAACAQKAQTTQWFSGKSFYRKILEDGLQRCVTFWYSNRVVFQEFQWSTLLFQPVWGPHACAQPSVSILDLLGGLSACRRTQKMSIRL